MSQSSPDEFALILEIAGRKVSKGTEPAEFLQWFKDDVPRFAQQLAQSTYQADGGTGVLMYWLGRALWNAFPQPSNHYRPKPLPNPAANGRCPCGSGDKYKRCCGSIAVPELFESVNLLRFVLDNISQVELKKLNARYLDPFALDDVAKQWTQEGQHHRAVLMLEPLFDEGKKLPKHGEVLVESLLESWPFDYKAKRRKAVCERLSKHPNKYVACAALQSNISMSASAGDMDAAWALFHTGMREFPDNVNFAALELILLLNSKRVADAKRRAEFWVHKLKRMGEEYDDYAARLMSMVESREDGSDLQYARGHSSLVESFASIAETEVIRFNAYSAAPKDADEPLVLQATADTAAAERRWMDRSGGSKPMLTSLHSAEEPLSPVEIISALESDSAGLNSFDVLDDITESLDYYVVDVPDLAAVQTLLLQRAETLFYGVLTSSTPKGLITAEHWHDLLPSLSREVPWGFMENRPLLRMMVRHIYHLRDRHLSDSTLWLTRAQVVLQVNNTDNHGLRGLVSSELLSLERPADALQLLDRYPDDGMNDSIMNRTLALFALNRQSEAAETLLDGGIWLREMRKSITQKHYARPRDLDHGQVTLGGRDEAWIYRQAMHSCWEAAGAIEWLKQQKPPRKQKATPPPQQETLEASDNNDASTFAGFDTKPLPAQAIKEQLDKVAPHGAWLLGITLASALTPGLDFSANRLIKPILARLTSDESSSGAFKPENELFESQLFKDVLDTFMAWNNHFISRISDSMGDLSDSQSGDSTNSLSSTDERIRWIVEDLSLASLSKRENLLDLVNGLVTGIDENPRGWGPISATARNRVIGPLQLMVASEAKEKTVESSTLSNVSFLGLAEDEFFLDEQSCLQNITELASLAILSRRS